MILVLLGGFLASVVGCTKALDEKATEDAKQLFLSDIAGKTQSALPPNHELFGDYQSFMGKKLEVEVIESTETANNATVKVQVKTIPIKNLIVLAEIAGKQFGAKASKFNMGNASQLIEQQDGMVRGQEQVELILLYNKIGDKFVFDKIQKPQPTQE